MARTSTPARVLCIDNSETFGGAIISLAHLVRGFDSDRYSVDILSGQPEETLDRLFPTVSTRGFRQKLPWQHHKVRQRLTEVPGLRWRPLRRLIEGVGATYWLLTHGLSTTLRYYLAAKRMRADIVHLNNNVESQFPAVFAARLAGVPCVAHARSFQVPRRALRVYLGMVDRHIAISEAIRENLEECGADPSRVTVVHDAVDIDGIRSAAGEKVAPPEPDLSGAEFTFGLFGRVVPWKGTHEFVKAAIEVLGKVTSARAYVVGDASDGDPGYFERARQMARDAGMDDRIVFTGYREDVPALMRGMDVVVHASNEPEPFGMVLIEAMAVGTPVIATRGGGPDDIIADGETGVLVERSSPDAIASALLKLERDAARRSTMAERASVRSEEYFTSARYGSEVMEIYERVMGGRGVEGGTTPARRVLIVDEALTFGGSIVSTANLIRGVDADRFEIVFASAADRSLVTDKLREAAATTPVKIVRKVFHYRRLHVLAQRIGRLPLWVLRKALVYGLYPVRLVGNTGFTLRMLWLILGKRVDLVQLNNGMGSDELHLVCVLLRKPRVVFLRGYTPMSRIERVLFLPGVKHFVAVSRHIKELAVADGVEPSRITVATPPAIPEQVPDEATAAVHTRHGLTAEHLVFGIVGRVVRWKGQAEFLRAARLVLERRPGAHAMVIGGISDGDEAYLHELWDFVDEHELGDRITFTGYRRDVHAYYSVLDVVVHCSIEPEPSGRVIFEAMSHGVPVVASCLGGPPEFVDSGTDGYIVDPENAEEVASRVSELLQDEDRRVTFGARARSKVERRYSKERYARAVEEVYVKALQAERLPPGAPPTE